MMMFSGLVSVCAPRTILADTPGSASLCQGLDEWERKFDCMFTFAFCMAGYDRFKSSEMRMLFWSYRIEIRFQVYRMALIKGG